MAEILLETVEEVFGEMRAGKAMGVSGNGISALGHLQSLCGNSLALIEPRIPAIDACDISVVRCAIWQCSCYTALRSSGATRHSRVKFSAVVASVNSAATLASPRRRNRRIPRCSFSTPKTGSTMAFLFR